MRKTLCIIAAVACLPLQALAEEFDQAALLRRMIDLDRLADPPPAGEITGMFSSYDRKSRIDAAGNQVDWDANADWGQFIRTEDDGWSVMAEMDGPGVITRIWSANPSGQIRFILDPTRAEVVERRRKRACERATRVCLEGLIEMIDALLPGSEILGKLGHPASLATVPVDPPRLSTDRYRATRYHYLLRFLAKGQLHKVLPELPVLKYGWPSRELLKKARRPLLDSG